MATRNIVLTDQQEELVHQLVASGRYQNASEALRAGLRLLEREEQAALDIRTRLMEGLAQAERGDLVKGSGADAVRAAFAQAKARKPQ
ncbi:MAG: type II toxin-antitoxin system ParD family antitoxin [Pelagimonas sp.]|uniref:type II toxin-antitoxin system ParD family antitoxin n=1 Tax=Pelagimonas sp. TaxID=2073170 RepID=UPI003D6AD1CE